MQEKRQGIIAVVGASQCSAQEAKWAEEVGRELAKQEAIIICGGLGFARNIIIVKLAQAVIAIGGSYGTLSKIAHARQHNIPVIGLKTWGLSRNGQPDNSIIPAKNPLEAVSLALSLGEATDTPKAV